MLRNAETSTGSPVQFPAGFWGGNNEISPFFVNNSENNRPMCPKKSDAQFQTDPKPPSKFHLSSTIPWTT